MTNLSRRHFLLQAGLALLSARWIVAAKPEPAWQSLFDGKTLTGWKAPDFSGQGPVSIENGTLVLGIGNDITGMNPTVDFPDMNYEISMEGSRLAGSDFFCGLTLPFGKKSFTIVLGGWGGALVGLSSINGDDASENETTKFIKFETDKWYKIRARVTSQKIEAWLDDAKIIDVETEGKKIDMRPGEIEMSAPFGLATYRTTGAFKEIKFRRIDDAAPAK